MTKRSYPYTAWILTAGYVPTQVKLVQPTYNDSDHWDRTEKGRNHHVGRLHPTLEAAIAAGREQVAASQARIDASQKFLYTKIANLDKAEKQK